MKKWVSVVGLSVGLTTALLVGTARSQGLFGNWESTPVKDVLARVGVLLDHRVQLIGHVTQVNIPGKDTTQYYMLNGYEGGQIMVKVVDQIPLPTTHVFVKGTVQVDAKDQGYIMESTRKVLDPVVVTAIVAEHGVKEAISQIAAGRVIDNGDKTPGTFESEPKLNWVLIVGAVVAGVLLLVVLLVVVVLLLRRPIPVMTQPVSVPATPIPSPQTMPAGGGEETVVFPSGDARQSLDAKTVAMSKGRLEVVSGGRPAGTQICLPAPYAIIGRRDARSNRGERYIGLDMEELMRIDPMAAKSLSREQAKITYDHASGSFTIENISKAGSIVTVNGKDLNTGDAVPLHDDATIQMPPYWEFKFHSGWVNLKKG